MLVGEKVITHIRRRVYVAEPASFSFKPESFEDSTKYITPKFLIKPDNFYPMSRVSFNKDIYLYKFEIKKHISTIAKINFSK